VPSAAFGGADRAKGPDNKPLNDTQRRLVVGAFHAIRQARAAGRDGIRANWPRCDGPICLGLCK
jgi:hypothetical protein